MRKHSPSKHTNGSGRKANRAPPALPETDAIVLDAPAQEPDPRETAQEAVHQVMTKDAAKTLTDGVDAVQASPTSAARGDDDLMSQPVKRS